jgi:hypothetical protein
MVLMDERTRMAGDVADRGGRHAVGVAEAVEAATDQDPVDGRGQSTNERTEPVGAVSPSRASGQDLGFDRRRQTTR